MIAWYTSPGRDESSQLHVAADKSYYNGGASNPSLSYTASVGRAVTTRIPAPTEIRVFRSKPLRCA